MILHVRMLDDDNRLQFEALGILEAMGTLFPGNTQVYVYPTRAGGELVTGYTNRPGEHPGARSPAISATPGEQPSDDRQ